MNQETAIKEFISQPQEYDYLMLASIQAKRQLKSKYLKKRIFEIKGKKCKECGSTKRLNIHHKSYNIIIPKILKKINFIDKRKRKNNQFLYSNENEKWELIETYFKDIFEKNIKNLKILCRNCHKKEHNNLLKNTGFIIPLKKEHKKDIGINESAGI